MSVAVGAAVAGWSAVTPLGSDLDAAVDRLLAGQRAAEPNPHFPARSYGCVLAAAIGDDPPRTPHDRILRRMGRFGYQVAREALEMGGRTGGPRLGLFSGVGGLRAHWDELLPALAEQSPDLEHSWQRGFRHLHPFWMLRHLSNNAHALLSADIDARGEGATFGGANAGAQALAAASWALAAGAVDAALVVAYDSLIEPETVVECTARGAATRSELDDLVAPYGEGADGFVPGEAAAALLLVPEDSPGSHLARVRTSSCADGSDGAPGTGAARAAIRTFSFEPTRTVVDGAALADPAFDAAERELFSSLGDPGMPLTAVQAALGQVGAAAPLVQAISMASCLRRRLLPPVAGLEQPAPGPLCPLAERQASEQRRSAVCLSAGAPGLVAATLIDLSSSEEPSRRKPSP